LQIQNKVHTFIKRNKMVLYFTAAWCGPCKMFKPTVQAVSAETGVSINYIDVDQQQDTAQKYGISSVPTIIVENDGNVVYRNSGVMSKPQLTQVLSQFK
jgi:thioredoxin 1